MCARWYMSSRFFFPGPGPPPVVLNMFFPSNMSQICAQQSRVSFRGDAFECQ